MPGGVLDHDPERKLAIRTSKGSRPLVETSALEVEKGQIVLVRPAPDSPLPVRSADPQHEESSSTEASDKEDEAHDRRVRGILRRSPTGGRRGSAGDLERRDGPAADVRRTAERRPLVPTPRTAPWGSPGWVGGSTLDQRWATGRRASAEWDVERTAALPVLDAHLCRGRAA